MHDEWPVLEFPELNSTVLDLFSRESGEEVAFRLLIELVKEGPNSHGRDIPLQTEEQLRWAMQVMNHSLAFPLSVDRQFGSARRSVHAYVHWLRSLTSSVDSSIPRPLIETPEKYFRGILDALRSIFVRRKVVDAVAVERQAGLIEAVLEAARNITREATGKYQDEVWSRSLSFMLNSADILLTPPAIPGDISCRVGSSVIESLFSLWLTAVADERIPSPTYWKTLSVLSAKWRHHVTVIEAWSRKLLALTVLVSRSVYGQDYCTIPVGDESLRSFISTTRSSVNDMDPDEKTKLLYDSWLNIFSLVPSPAQLLDHNPRDNVNGKQVASLNGCSVETENEQQPLCFFLAVLTVQRMIDIFYGDNRVPIHTSECDAYMKRVEVPPLKESHHESTRRLALSTPSAESRTLSSLSAGATATNTVTGSISGGHSRANSDMKAHRTSRMSDRSIKATTVDTSDSGAGGESSSASSAYRRATSLSSTGEVTGKEGPTGVTVSRIVAYSLAKSGGRKAWTGEKAPRSERILDLTMQWLLEAASVKRTAKAYGDERHLTDDVISSLSLCSGDTLAGDGEQYVKEGMAPPPMGDRPVHYSHSHDEQRKSFGGGSISSASSYNAPSPSRPLSVDGVEAGRAAAMAALTRIICSKTTTEDLPETQLAQFLSMLHQSLIEKERLVLCSIVYHGHSLFRLALPGIESLLPHFLFALDVVLIESAKLRLHPSYDEVEMRRACLRSLQTLAAWPTIFGVMEIPQLPESSPMKVSVSSFIQLRLRIYKTLVFSLRNETDSINLQMTLSMCSILCEEAASFDLTANEKEKKELMESGGNAAIGTTTQEKAFCPSIVRGVVSAVCDRLCRPEWSGDFNVCLAAIDTLNALSTLNPQLLFRDKDLSTGMLIVSSLCRFIDTQLSKPPPSHSKDLHSSVVAAFQSVVVWLCAAPLLAECDSVLSCVADTVQLGITGSKKPQDVYGERKSASKRVFDAAESLMYSLFTLVGRPQGSAIVDERRLLYLFGPSLIDTTKFQHFLVSGDSLLSIHEASHIPTLAKGAPCVLYVRRSPMHVASVGFARLTPGLIKEGDDRKDPLSSPSISGLSISTPPSMPSPSPSSATLTPGGNNAGPSQTAVAYEKGKAFELPPDFHKNTCKVDALYRPLETTKESEQMLGELQKAAAQENLPRPDWAWAKLSKEERIPRPKEPSKTCNSIRVFLHDFGLVNAESYGKEFVPLDAGQSADFYRDLHDTVDSCPAVSLCTSFIFYVREGQRSSLDILENGMNLQSLSPSFLLLLSSLGEGVEVGVHEGWTGHWSTAFSAERKPVEEKEGVDHYIIDGISYVLWRSEGGSECAFVMPTQRAVRHFKQELPPIKSTRYGGKSPNTSSVSSEYVQSPKLKDHGDNDDVFSTVSSRGGIYPYSGGGSSMGNAPPPRRSNSDLRIVLVWLERLEDATHFPLEELMCTCDDGGDKATASSTSSSVSSPPPNNHSPGPRSQSSSSTVPPHMAILLHEVEPGLVFVRTRGSAMRFGAVGPLVDGVVVSLACLPSFIRLTLLNITRRNVAEVENFQHSHVKRRGAISEFAKKYALHANYDDFLVRFIS